MNWKDILKRILATKIVERFLARFYAFFRAMLKMRILDLPGVLELKRRGNIFPLESKNFHYMDKDLASPTIWRDVPSPASAKYKIVSFYRGTEGMPIIEMLIIAFFRRWRLASLAEVLSVIESENICSAGLGDNYNLLAYGTIVRRSSSPFDLCCPLVAVRLVEKEISNSEKRTLLYLQDVFANCPSGYHIVFRVS